MKGTHLYGGRKFDGHSVPLIAYNYIVILEKLGLADERTTNCSFQKLGSDKSGTVCLQVASLHT